MTKHPLNSLRSLSSILPGQLPQYALSRAPIAAPKEVVVVQVVIQHVELLAILKACANKQQLAALTGSPVTGHHGAEFVQYKKGLLGREHDKQRKRP